eukprot:gene17166-18887_t
METLIKSAELELLAAIDVQIGSGAILTTEDIENAYHALLEDTSLEKHALVNAQNIVYVTKSDVQIAYSPSKNDSGFRIPERNENKQVIDTALQVREYSHRSSFIKLLNDDGRSVPSYRALQIEAPLANEVINQLKFHPSGVNFLSFLQRRQFACFNFDNSDFTIATPRKSQWHGGLFAVFRKASSHASI